MPKKLTPEQVEGYARDGYVCPVDAFSAERTRAWRDRLENLRACAGARS